MQRVLLALSVFMILPLYALPQTLYSPIVINEVMANPKGASGANGPEDRNEFVELYNIGPDSVNIKNWYIFDFDARDNIIAWNDSSLLTRYPNVVINETLIPPFSYTLILDPEYTSANAVGGEIQPYNFPDSLIILTVGNTTIGDELSTNDPILIYSPNGDSCSFGTPFDSLDGFPPIDYGSTNDGLSWERVSPWAKDTISNWIRSLDSTGSTPGRENSVLSYYDLSVDSIYNTPSLITLNGQTTVSIVISNIGYQPAYYWNLHVFDDVNNDSIEDTNEQLHFQYGMPLFAQAETTISFIWDSVSTGEHSVFAVVNFSEDRNLNNNRLHKIISVSSPDTNNGRSILIKNIFSPDNDGIDDSLLVQYNFTEANGKLNISIYNMNGQQIRQLINQKISDKSGIVAWDGKKDNGQLAPIGIYIIYLEYKTSKTAITEKTSAVLAKRLY